MNNVNRVIVVGNLTRDPELRYTTTGVAVCDLSIAVNRSWKGKDGKPQEQVSFFDITIFKRTAEVCAEHLKKGRPVLVDGSLVQERWENEKQEKRSRVKIVASAVHFLGPRPDSGEGKKPEPAAAAAPAGAGPVDEDVPF